MENSEVRYNTQLTKTYVNKQLLETGIIDREQKVRHKDTPLCNTLVKGLVSWLAFRAIRLFLTFGR